MLASCDSGAHLRNFGARESRNVVGRKLASVFRQTERTVSCSTGNGCLLANSWMHDRRLHAERITSATQSKWEEHISMGFIPSREEFTKFVENIEHATATCAPGNSFCGFCGSQVNDVYVCSFFGNHSPCVQLKEAKKLDLCPNCLQKGHQVRACKYNKCRTCNMKHHILLHISFAPFCPTNMHKRISSR